METVCFCESLGQGVPNPISLNPTQPSIQGTHRALNRTTGTSGAAKNRALWDKGAWLGMILTNLEWRPNNRLTRIAFLKICRVDQPATLKPVNNVSSKFQNLKLYLGLGNCYHTIERVQGYLLRRERGTLIFRFCLLYDSGFKFPSIGNQSNPGGPKMKEILTWN